MIKEKTVFVFGAGLSSDYEFPTGSRLRDEICRLITWDSGQRILPEQIKRLTQELNVLPETLKRIRLELGRGGFDTIDDFIEQRSEQSRKIAKYLIAMAISGYENPNAFDLRSSDNCFYRFLFNKMKQDATIENFKDNKVAFVTFNYDRSFEFFLSEALSNYFENIQEENVDNIMREIEIVHVHGMLGQMRWQSSSPRDYRPTFAQLTIAAQGIVNFNEIDQDYSEYKKARELIRKADNVIFVGFGFHKLNLSRLVGENCLEGKKRILATRGGNIDDVKVKEIDRITGGKLNSGHMKTLKAVPFAKEYLTWL